MLPTAIPGEAERENKDGSRCPISKWGIVIVRMRHPESKPRGVRSHRVDVAMIGTLMTQKEANKRKIPKN